MPWRLIGFIFLLGVFLIFIVLNLNNACDVSFGFKVVPGVPVYLTALFSFVLGLLWSVPIIISLQFKKGKHRKMEAGESRPLLPKKRGKKKAEAPQEPGDPALKNDEPYRKDGPYGID
ncbi:MAG: hypothetical protein LBT95_06640 [Treponema sp.]|jgi:uncharacterized integral membrane protein|nr:hypothetical protein [Treponema sp.]